MHGTAMRLLLAGFGTIGMLMLPQMCMETHAAVMKMNMGSSVLAEGVNTDDLQTVDFGDHWYVIGYDTSGNIAKRQGMLTLLHKDTWGVVGLKFDADSPYSNEYAGSTLAQVLDSDTTGGFFYIDDSNIEKTAVQSRTLEGGGINYDPEPDDESYYYDSNKVKGSSVTANFWPLSWDEAEDLPSAVLEAAGGIMWFLRSPGYNDEAIAIVDSSQIRYEWSVNQSGIHARPACYVNLDSILFTSVTSWGKPSGTVGADALTSVGTYSSGSWKLTLLDTSRSFSASRVGSGSLNSGDTVSLSYSNATLGQNEYISAILVNSSNDIVYYGRIADMSTESATASGTLSVTIPTALPGGSYSLKVFSEKFNENGDWVRSDSASALSSIPLSVKKTPEPGDFTVTLPPNTVYDGNVKTATVSDVSGMGTITLKYYDADGSQLSGAPTELGTYTIKLDVTEGSSFAAGSNITKNEWSFTITPETVDVTGVSVDPTSLALEVGEFETLEATVTPSDASNRNITWDSDDDDIATVTQGGKVTGVHEGSTIIRVTTANGGFDAECAVTVHKQASGGSRSEKKSRHKKPSTPSEDYDYAEWNGQYVYGGLVDGVFAPTTMIPASAYPKFNAFLVKKVKAAVSGAAITVNAAPWTSINKALADAFTEKGDVSLTLIYTPDGGAPSYQITILAGTNLSELLDANGYIGFSKLGELFGNEPVIEQEQTE